jgi:hypothetical protein
MKQNKVGLVGLVSSPSKSLNHHNGGWTLVLKSMFNAEVLTEKDDWDLFDELIVSEGVNYREGIFNFFGGVQESFYIKLEKLNDFKGKVYCVNESIDYNELCSKRKELKERKLFCNKLPVVIKLNEFSNKLVLGDSHSVSVYRPGYSISKNDGKTLHGFLKLGLKNYIPDKVDELVFYAGNIDIRFHIHRFKGRESVVDLIRELFNQLEHLKLKKVTLVSLLPIEDESRKLPKTGLLNNKPFYGTKEDRTYYVKEFNKLLKRGALHYGYDLIEWDFNYDKGLSFDYMESRQSVHLRPKSYKYISELC